MNESWLATPDGSVTLVFGDIVASTRRLVEIGEARWLDELRRHNRLVRDAVRTHAGAEVKFLGDGWMVAFADPADALAFAVHIRDTLDAELRIGVHTGHPVKEGADFLGRDVVVASRLASAAGPGEILVSSVTRLDAGARGRHDFARRCVDLKGLGPHVAFTVTGGARSASDSRTPLTRRRVVHT